MRALFGLISGLLFGLGLAISGLANPAKVKNFLDIFGTWDPSLALVMAGAIAITFVGYRLAWKRATPLFDSKFFLPTAKDVDARLVSGAVIFGLGWAIGGFCPGPAMVGIPMLNAGTILFVVMMFAGMILAQVLTQPRKQTLPAE